jgi:pimeloyl-ACP methyl ester carboxylesterase
VIAKHRFAGAYSLYGDPANPPLLFVHGIRLGREIWERHANALRDAYYVATLDLPGHGTLADVPFETDTVGALLSYVIDDVLKAPPIVIGYSLGGYVAMQFAHDAPERTAAIVLADCTLDFNGWLRSPYEWVMRTTARIPAATLRRMITFAFRLTLPREVAEVVVPLRFNRAVFADVRRAGSGVISSELLRDYDKPVLIVNGEWDVLFRGDERKFARRAHADVEVIGRTDHVAPLRKPDEFTKIVRRFAQRVFRPSTSSG